MYIIGDWHLSEQYIYIYIYVCVCVWCVLCVCGKSISFTYSECVFGALVIQHAKHMRHIVICGLSDSSIFFSTLSHKWHDLRGKVIERKMC